MAEFDVLVVGDANPDLLLRGDVRPRFGQEEQLLTGANLVLGGSAAITAVGCAKLGLRTALLAAVGDDMFGALVRDQLTVHGVRLISPPAEGVPTGLTVVLSETDDRAMLTLPGTIAALNPADVTGDLLARARHVHVSSLYLQPALTAGLAEVVRTRTTRRADHVAGHELGPHRRLGLAHRHPRAHRRLPAQRGRAAGGDRRGHPRRGRRQAGP